MHFVLMYAASSHLRPALFARNTYPYILWTYCLLFAHFRLLHSFLISHISFKCRAFFTQVNALLLLPLKFVSLYFNQYFAFPFRTLLCACNVCEVVCPLVEGCSCWRHGSSSFTKSFVFKVFSVQTKTQSQRF